MKLAKLLLAITLVTLVLPHPKSAIADSLDADVSATVPSTYFYAPTLISPEDGSTTNNPIITFNWKRPSPTPESSTLDHYDLFIDDSIFANNISDSLTTLDNYFYYASASGNFFYVTLKYDLTEGYHTWRVAVYDDLGQNAATGNWTFYIDSIAPFISLTSIDSTSYSWNTSTSGSIPDETDRYLTITSDSPKLSGQVETNANFQFSLICPSGVPSGCTNQSWIQNSTDGNWEQQLSGLIPNIYYTVQLSATDTTSNSTIFPNFYIKYSTSSITVTTTTTPTATATPTATPTPTSITSTPSPSLTPLPSPSAILTPPPELAAQITPTQFIARTPPAPTPPPARKQAAVVIEPNLIKAILIILLCLGLPLHLGLSAFGLDIKTKFILKFLFAYIFPFLRPQNNTTRPFSQITMYDPQNTNKALYKVLSDINGKFYIPKNIPDQVFISIEKLNYQWKNSIITKNVIQNSCLNPQLKSATNQKEKLQIYIYQNIRIIPLIVAILTSTICMFYLRNTYTAIYFYLSVQAGFSEYYYPKLKKD